MKLSRLVSVALGIALSGVVVLAARAQRTPSDDAAEVASLDTVYQAAVKRNDAAAMDNILADDFVLVTGRGQVFTKTDLIEATRKKSSV
jgi:hypothetical protein